MLDETLCARFGGLPSEGIRSTDGFPLNIPPNPLECPDVVDRMSTFIFGTEIGESLGSRRLQFTPLFLGYVSVQFSNAGGKSLL